MVHTTSFRPRLCRLFHDSPLPRLSLRHDFSPRLRSSAIISRLISSLRFRDFRKSSIIFRFWPCRSETNLANHGQPFLYHHQPIPISARHETPRLTRILTISVFKSALFHCLATAAVAPCLNAANCASGPIGEALASTKSKPVTWPAAQLTVTSSMRRTSLTPRFLFRSPTKSPTSQSSL